MIVREPPPSEPEPRYDFVRLGEQIAGSWEVAAEQQVTAARAALEQTRIDAKAVADAMIMVAEERVKQAEEQLKHARLPAKDLRERIREKDQELADLNDRLKAYGETVLKAHRTFNVGNESENP
jgi:uncharacterized protein YgbK (DUF1537 family)